MKQHLHMIQCPARPGSTDGCTCGGADIDVPELSLADFPNLWAEHYRRRLLDERMSPVEAFTMLQGALARNEIDQAEALRLLDMPLPHMLINSRGGCA